MSFLLVRVVIPLHVLAGAVLKFGNASPDALPDWMIAAVESIGWNPFEAPTTLPGMAEEELLMALLGVFIAIEVIAAAVMFFIARLARPVAILILSLFVFVLLAEIWRHSVGLDVSLWSAAFDGDCGCYGTAAAVAPGVMLLIDLVLLAGAVLLTPSPRIRPVRKTPKWAVISLAGLSLLGAFMGTNPIRSEAQVETPWHQRQMRHWLGHPFEETPLFAQIQRSDSPLSPSEFGPVPQVWVLYRRSCGVCHTLFERQYAEPRDDLVVVAVHIPPSPDDIVGEDLGEVECAECQWTELPVGPAYQYDSPVEIFLDEEHTIQRVVNPKLEAAGVQSPDYLED